MWELQPGAIWQYALEQQIESIHAAAVFVGKQGLGPWQSEEIYAFLQEFIRRKCPVIPVMLIDSPKQPKLPIFLRNRHWVDFRQTDPDPLVQLIWGITGQKPETESNTAQVITVQQPNVIQNSAVDDEVAALRRELELLKTNQAKSSISQPQRTNKPQNESQPLKRASSSIDDLSSEKEIDYTRLRDLLKAQRFKDADEETYQRMLEATGRQREGRFRAKDLLNFPCTDLKTIDRLWVTHSDGRFGFSVQKEIYVQCGAALDGQYPGDKIWYKFCDRIGWRVSGSFIDYSDVTFSTEWAPKGHLPSITSLVRLNKDSYLFSCIQTCKV